MAFMAGCLAVGKAAPFFGPFGWVVGGAAVGLAAVEYLQHRRIGAYFEADFDASVYPFECASTGQPAQSMQSQQEQGDIGSSEVEETLELGTFGYYAVVLRDYRSHSTVEGYKYHVEADHIPPIDSLKRAKDCDGFDELKEKNPVLYDMVMKAINGEKGMLFVIQVGRHDHRTALSTGNSHESQAARLVIARYIARGEAMRMLKLSMIIAHPFASQDIRARAERFRSTANPMFHLSEERTISYYNRAFRGTVNHYYWEQKILDDQDYEELMKWVDDEGYLDAESSEYREILEAVDKAPRVIDNRKKRK